MRTWVAVGLACLSSTATASEHAGDFPPPSPELLAPAARTPELPSMHPAIVLRDVSGKPVAESDQPASARRTCGGCHEVSWIEAHDYHATAGARLGQGQASIGCFLCHVRAADNQARLQAAGTPWADTATLAAVGLATLENGTWHWRKDAFAADGSISPGTLGLGRPSDRACGFCHGVVDHGHEPIALSRDASQRMTDAQGMVFSGQRISDSAVNLAGKAGLTRPWDVHAERMVSCASCHFSPNHPAYAWSRQAPEHLQFDARRSAITEYLRRPDHRLARGRGDDLKSEASIRRCESCHDASKVHGWLPRAERHFSALLCESCHVPAAYAPARQETDWTVLSSTRQPRVVYRGLRADGFVTGFRPALLPRPEPDGTAKLGPQNLITSWFWTEETQAGRRRVATETLARALFVGDAHKPGLVLALDRDGDGKLSDEELLIDSEARRDVVRELLLAEGVKAPQIAGEIEAHAIHHGVSPGRFATRDCSACHTGESRLTEPFVLASAVPFAATTAWADGKPRAGVQRDGSGRLVLVPEASRLHVFGHTRSSLIDGLGMFFFASALAGAAGHGFLRVRSARRRSKERS